MNLLRGVGCCGTDIDRLALNKLLEETGDDSMFQKEQLILQLQHGNIIATENN